MVYTEGPNRFARRPIACTIDTYIHVTINTKGSFGRSVTNILWLMRVTSRISKVLFVAMDEVSFDYMDALAPGCTAMFPMTAAVSEALQLHESCGNNVELSKSPIIGDTTAIAVVRAAQSSLQVCRVRQHVRIDIAPGCSDMVHTAWAVYARRTI